MNLDVLDSARAGLSFFGKYRGRVKDNNDPAKLGRVLVEVPAVSGMQTNWALPATPYAGPGVGLLLLPPVDALVWVEFEGGNPDFPIWTGCFWGRAEDVPIVYQRNAADPARVKVLKTASTTVIIDDTNDTGTVSVSIVQPAVTTHPVTLTFNSQGAELTTGVCDITVQPETGITAKVSETTITETPEQIVAKTGESQIQMTATSIAATSPAVTVTAEESIGLTSTGPTSVEASEVSLTAAATTLTTVLEVEGISSFTGAMAVEGAVDIAGALAVEGFADFAGGVAIEGGGVIDGVPII